MGLTGSYMGLVFVTGRDPQDFFFLKEESLQPSVRQLSCWVQQKQEPKALWLWVKKGYLKNPFTFG